MAKVKKVRSGQFTMIGNLIFDDYAALFPAGCSIEEICRKEASRKFIDQIFGGSVSAFAAALNDNAISKEDLKELKKMLEDDEL